MKTEFILIKCKDDLDSYKRNFYSCEEKALRDPALYGIWTLNLRESGALL